MTNATDGIACDELPSDGTFVKHVKYVTHMHLTFGCEWQISKPHIGGPRIGFDIFRFEEGKIVEHWDNLQQTAAETSPSGHTMTGGPTVASDFDKTEFNKTLMQTYMDDLLNGRRDRFRSYFDGNNYIQRNALVADGSPA